MAFDLAESRLSSLNALSRSMPSALGSAALPHTSACREYNIVSSAPHLHHRILISPSNFGSLPISLWSTGLIRCAA